MKRLTRAPQNADPHLKRLSRAQQMPAAFASEALLSLKRLSRAVDVCRLEGAKDPEKRKQRSLIRKHAKQISTRVPTPPLSGKPYTPKFPSLHKFPYLVSMHPAAWVYIMTNDPRHTTLYIGSSVDLPTRTWEHRTKRKPRSFTAQYNLAKLVYYEPHESQEEAVRREWFIKGKSRKWKEELINKFNPEWRDLTEEVVERYHH